MVQVKIVGSDTEIFFEGGYTFFPYLLYNTRKNTYKIARVN